jgi:hypothetical protein
MSIDDYDLARVCDYGKPEDIEQIFKEKIEELKEENRALSEKTEVLNDLLYIALTWVMYAYSCRSYPQTESEWIDKWSREIRSRHEPIPDLDVMK